MADTFEELEQVHFDRAAEFAFTSIVASNAALVSLAPGDGTQYYVAVVLDMAGKLWVASSFAPLYRWQGHEVHFSYVMEKWGGCRSQNVWTAGVTMRFLNTLAPLLAAHAEG